MLGIFCGNLNDNVFYGTLNKSENIRDKKNIMWH